MNTRLHKLARTTPAVRAEMALSADSVAVLACRHGVSEATARKWKSRSSPHDRSHTAHKLQTTLSPAQEFVAVELRRTLLLPLGDLLANAEPAQNVLSIDCDLQVNLIENTHEVKNL